MRLTINAISDETGVDRRTVKKWLVNVQADEDGKYRLRDFVSALRGQSAGSEMERERLAKIAAERRLLEIDEATKLGRLLDTEEVRKYWAGRIVRYKQWLMNQRQLTEAQKRDLLLHFSEAMEPELVAAPAKPKRKRVKRKAAK